MNYFSEQPLFAQPVVVIDTETTGLIPELGHRVIEIAAVRLENGRETAQFSTLLNPGRPLDPAASRVSGITNADLVGQPAFAEMSAQLLTLIDGALLVAHNAPFDAAFIGMELFIHFRQQQITPISPPNPWLCTLELARRCFHFDHNNLGAVAQQLGVRMGRAHRALGDVYTTAEILKRMARELAKQRLISVDDLLFAQGGPVYTPPPPVITLPPVIEEALANGRTLSILYGDTTSTWRTITPYYPTLHQGQTYLIAYCHARQEQRTFRLDRIMNYEL